MTPHARHIAALVTAAKKAPDKTKLKAKIKKVKQTYAWNKFLAQ